jgi:hypothetical protein
MTILGHLCPYATISLYKALRGWFVGYTRGQSITSLNTIYQIDKSMMLDSGIPGPLQPFIWWIEHKLKLLEGDDPSSIRAINYLMFVLSCDRLYSLPEKVDLTSILTPTSSKPDPRIIKLIPLALLRLGITKQVFWSKLNQSVNSFRQEVVVSAGPNGQATWTCIQDASAIIQSRAL